MQSTFDDLVTAAVACQIIGGRDTPIHPATLWRGIKAGRFPKPLKIGPGTARWRVSELTAVVNKAAADRDLETA